jgi:Ca2+-binding EF-hand superfamily protein
MTAASKMEASPADKLRDAAKRHIRGNAFLALRDYAQSMPMKVFGVIMAVLVFYRLANVAVFFVAWQGWLLEPAQWATGSPVVSDYMTPFHGHPNLYGWRFGFQGLMVMHNITGVMLFLVCLVPLVGKKGGKTHRYFGRAFVAFWLLHLFNGLGNSTQIMLTRGFDATHYLDSTKQGFSLYLFVQFAFISSVVIDFLLHGLAALQYKNHLPGRVMRAAMIVMPASSIVFGLSLMAWGVAHLAGSEAPATPSTTEFAVIYIVQVPAYVFLLGKNMAYWLRPTPRSWLQGWVTEHQRNMMFCVQVTLYTGVANATMRFAPWLTPIMFGSIEVGFIIWLLLKERAIRRRVIQSRLGLALVSAVAGRPSDKPASSLSQSDAKWIAKLFDLDGNRVLDINDIERLLGAQGLSVTEHELERIVETLDRDGNGVIDGDELATFLTSFFVPDPSAADDVRLAFRGFDTSGDGRIARDELREALNGHSGSVREDELDDIMALVDTDRDGRIDTSELAAALAR